VGAWAQDQAFDLSGEWSGSLFGGEAEGIDDTGLLIVDNTQAWLYGYNKEDRSYSIRFGSRRMFVSDGVSGVLALMLAASGSNRFFSHSLVLQLAARDAATLEIFKSEQSVVVPPWSAPRQVERKDGSYVFRKTNFLQKSLAPLRAELAAGRITRPALERILAAFPRNPQATNDLAQAEALLRFLGAGRTQQRDAHSVTGSFGPAEITLWLNSYGKQNTFGIRYGAAGGAYGGSNDTYFEYR
jgi:hypothetical protein